MSFFKKPAGAVIVSVILCAAILVMNTQSMLGEEIDAVEDGFYENVDGQRSIYSRLQEKLSASNGIWTIVYRYNQGVANELADAREYLIWACDDASISSMKYANDDLNEQFSCAVNELEAHELTEEERELAEEYVTAFNGAQKMIDENSYNSEVLEFMRGTYNKFPTRELAEFAGVYPPETFS